MDDKQNYSSVLPGEQFPAIKIIQLYDFDKWENFIWEYVNTKIEYNEVEKFAGAGDQGRDIIGIVEKNDDSDIWDNYQCKHYNHALMPTDIWLELGKLCYYTHIEEYTKPRKYYFVAPHGIGTKLSKLIDKPNTINKQLIEKWDEYCKDKITNKSSTNLEGELLEHVKEFDFSILEKISMINLIKEHREGDSFNHLRRFGGQIPLRPETEPVPDEVKEYELTYIEKLLNAYESDTKVHYESVELLPEGSRYKKHLFRTRECFYKAEQLKNFSRDKIDPKLYDLFKEEIFSGVIDIAEGKHENGFICVIEVEKEARKLPITSNLLRNCATMKDQVGVCHQLANENKLAWQENEDE